LRGVEILPEAVAQTMLETDTTEDGREDLEEAAPLSEPAELTGPLFRRRPTDTFAPLTQGTNPGGTALKTRQSD